MQQVQTIWTDDTGLYCILFPPVQLWLQNTFFLGNTSKILMYSGQWLADVCVYSTFLC